MVMPLFMPANPSIAVVRTDNPSAGLRHGIAKPDIGLNAFFGVC